MNIDELHNKLAEKDWLIEDLTEFEYLLIAHVKEIMEEQLTIPVVIVPFVCEHKYKDNVCDKRGVRKCLNCSKLEQAN